MKYIDIHCHLNLNNFDLDIDEVIRRSNEKEVGMIVVGVDRDSSEKAIKIAEINKNIWACIGLHPADNSKEIFDFDFYRKLAEHPKVVAIGETGFDYYNRLYNDKQRQQEVFEKQIMISSQLKKPLMLHLRNGINSSNAYEDAIEVLKKYSKVNGNVHFFAGSLEQARSFTDLGFKISFTGVITFARNYDEVIKNIPLNMIMVETDSPYVAPIPYRGGRNEPSYIIEVANKIADIRGETLENVLPHLINNAKEFFGINF